MSYLSVLSFRATGIIDTYLTSYVLLILIDLINTGYIKESLIAVTEPNIQLLKQYKIYFLPV